MTTNRATANARRPLQESAARAQLAALRRGLGKEPGEAPEMLPVIFPMLDGRRLDRRDQKIAFLIASLFASYPRPYPRSETYPNSREPSAVHCGSFSCPPIATSERTTSPTPATAAEDSRTGPTPIERRLISLLDRRFDDLSEQLRGLVKLLAAKEIPVDWAQLTRDLSYWDHPARLVQIRWAEAFWSEVSPLARQRRLNPAIADEQSNEAGPP